MADEQPKIELNVNLRIRHSAEPLSEVFVTSKEPYLNTALYLPSEMLEGVGNGPYVLSFSPAPPPPPPTQNASEQGSSGTEAGSGSGEAESDVN